MAYLNFKKLAVAMFPVRKFTLLRKRMKLVSLGIHCRLWETLFYRNLSCSVDFFLHKNKLSWKCKEVVVIFWINSKKIFILQISSQMSLLITYPELEKYIGRFIQPISRPVLVYHLLLVFSIPWFIENMCDKHIFIECFKTN